jgi:hypothetical protein
MELKHVFSEKNVYYSSMKKIVFLVWLFLIPAISFAEPSIAFDDEMKDFGKVTAGDILEHGFEVKNTGDKELIIEKVIPS